MSIAIMGRCERADTRRESDGSSTTSPTIPWEPKQPASLLERVIDSRKRIGRSSDEVRNQGWRRIVRNFTPSWFAATMGTGIVSILLFNMPYNGLWLYHLSIVCFVLNITIFTLATVISLLRIVLYPEIWTAMIRHPQQSTFLGTIPMGLGTLGNMVVFVCVPAWGDRFVTLAWAIWWIVVALSITVCFFMPFIIIYLHQSSLSRMTAVWLLPVVAPIVCATQGATVAAVLPPNRAFTTIIISYILLGTGFPIAMIILTIYFARLTIHRLPPPELIVSMFLPLGPIGQGAYAVMKLGVLCRSVLPIAHPALGEMAGEILYILGLFLGLILFGFAFLWLFIAIASTTRRKFPFNMGWWGFVFPIGVLAQLTQQLGKEISSSVLRVTGTVIAVVTICLWIVVASGTVIRTWQGTIFVAPCLADMKGDVRGRCHRDTCSGGADLTEPIEVELYEHV